MGNFLGDMRTNERCGCLRMRTGGWVIIAVLLETCLLVWRRWSFDEVGLTSRNGFHASTVEVSYLIIAVVASSR
jgi:hypothetical protein